MEGVEACDDGNLVNGDGCDADCTISCSEGDLNYEIDGRCYMAFETSVGWLRARMICVTLGGHLVQIEDAAENDIIYSMISGDTWIGLNDDAVEGTWIWDLGELGEVPMTFSHWEGGDEPDGGDCVRMRGDGTWEDRSCDEGNRYICERPPPA